MTINNSMFHDYDGVVEFANIPTPRCCFIDGIIGNFSTSGMFSDKAVDGDVMYFTADTVRGIHIIRHDQTTGALEYMPNGGPLEDQSIPMILMDNVLYFINNDVTNGEELWKYDLNTETLSIAADVNPGTGDTGTMEIVEFDGDIYYDANDGTDGRELWVQERTSGRAWAVATGINATDASWSSDGTMLTFAAYLSDEHSEVFSVNADGSDLTQLTEFGRWVWKPSFSPDGTQIVFASDRDNREWPYIYVMDADGQHVRQLTGH